MISHTPLQWQQRKVFSIFVITTDIPYLVLMGEIWGVYFEAVGLIDHITMALHGVCADIFALNMSSLSAIHINKWVLPVANRWHCYWSGRAFINQPNTTWLRKQLTPESKYIITNNTRSICLKWLYKKIWLNMNLFIILSQWNST